MRHSRFQLRDAIACGVGGLAPALLLAPLAAKVAGGADTPRRLVVVVLLLEVVYLLGGYACLGLRASKGRAAVVSALILSLPPLILLGVAAVGAGSPRALAAAQPAAVATALLGWGVGRACRDACSRPGPATALAFVVIGAFGINLLPVSHLSPWLETTPWLGRAALLTNPFVAVTNSVGYDIIRSDALYDALTLSGYRFRYPDPMAPPLALASLGLLAGYLRLRTHGRRSRRTGSPLRSFNEEIPR